MKLFSKEALNYIKSFLVKTGIMFPSGKRTRVDRRSGYGRRIKNSYDYFSEGGKEHRETDQRTTTERRKDWVRSGMWSSVSNEKPGHKPSL